MSEPRPVIDLFAEDRAHEELIGPIVERVAEMESRRIRVRVISARGGHGRATDEFRLYQRKRLKAPPPESAALVIVAIDANCDTHTAAVQAIMDAVRDEFRTLCIPACPDPHIERWFLADESAFHAVVGPMPSLPKRKCGRDFYKQLLAQAVIDAGHPPTLGGLEFAREIAEAMDLYRAGRSERSLKHFIEGLRSGLRGLPEG